MDNREIKIIQFLLQKPGAYTFIRMLEAIEQSEYRLSRGVFSKGLKSLVQKNIIYKKPTTKENTRCKYWLNVDLLEQNRNDMTPEIIELLNATKDFNKVYHDDSIFYLLERFTAIEFNSNGNLILESTQEPIFSNFTQRYFKDMIEALLINCFVNNPDLWYKSEKREDLEFEIKIKANWHQIPTIFEKIKQYQTQCLQNKNLIPIIFDGRTGYQAFQKDDVGFHDPRDQEAEWKLRKEYIGEHTPEDFYNRAYRETRERFDFYNKVKSRIALLKPKYLKIIDEELNKTIDDEKKKRLVELRLRIENEYPFTFESEEPVMYWDAKEHPIITNPLRKKNFEYQGKWLEYEEGYRNQGLDEKTIGLKHHEYLLKNPIKSKKHPEGGYRLFDTETKEFETFPNILF